MIGVDERGRGAGLGFALLGSGVAWTVHLLAAWAISELACTAGVAQGRVAGVAVLTWILLALSVVLLALSAGSTAYAWSVNRRLDPEQRALMRIGWVLGVLFTVTIAAQTLPLAWFVHGC